MQPAWGRVRRPTRGAGQVTEALRSGMKGGGTRGSLDGRELGGEVRVERGGWVGCVRCGVVVTTEWWRRLEETEASLDGPPKGSRWGHLSAVVIG